jgi:hypothetical protein
VLAPNLVLSPCVIGKNWPALRPLACAVPGHMACAAPGHMARAAPGHMPRARPRARARPHALCHARPLGAAQYNRTHVRNVGRRQRNRGDPSGVGSAARGRPFLSTECPQSVRCRRIDRPADPKRNRARNLDVVVPLNGIPQDVVFWGLTALGLGRTFRRSHGPPGGPADSRDGPRKDGPNRPESRIQGGSKPRPSQLWCLMRWTTRSEPKTGHEAPMAGHYACHIVTPDQSHASQPHAAQRRARPTPADPTK